jgi:PPM family protein phosphatase
MTPPVVRLDRPSGTGRRSPALVLDAAASSIAGPRADNQDAACAAPRLLAVADGVGGKVGGGVASAVVIDRLSRTLDGAAEGAMDAVLASAVAAANAGIRSRAGSYPRWNGMATTLTAVALGRDGSLVVAHIGDARAYLLRDGRVVQLTTDHTLVQGLVDAGVITAEQAREHPMRSILLNALHGIEDDLAAVDVSAHPVRPGDRLLVCSDGLSGVARPETIHRILSEERRPGDAVSRLVRAALAAGTTDNVTAVVGDVMPEGAAPSGPPVLVGAISDHERPSRTNQAC